MTMFLVFDYPECEVAEVVECLNEEAIIPTLAEWVAGTDEDRAAIFEALMLHGVWNDEGGCIRLRATGVSA